MPSLSTFIRATACAIALAARSVDAAVDPALLFGTKCSGCHTYGKGDKVGPDLKGVTNRHSRTWLTAWIRSSERVIKSGDPTAVALFKTFKQQRMPDQSVAPEDILALIDYLAAGGPEMTEGTRPRHAMTATPAEVVRGRQLFMGTVSAKNDGASCASCHMVREPVVSIGATFGGDLTHAYSHFQDTALSAFLKQPCFPRVLGKGGVQPLTEDEAFSIKAFLRQVDLAAAVR